MARRASPPARRLQEAADALASERDVGRAAFNERVLALLAAGEHMGRLR